ncbi:MAG TPA: tetraacyldisaccharide 4'-kinase [Gemmatimonadales bacterium]|nr:tetraacyldisaccharide 4'-kinase [Gemmatimonadales bacterium]
MSPARVTHWLWSDGAAARVARVPLIPLAVLYRGAMQLRATAYRRGWRRAGRLPLPAVAVGNLSVGGTGKTPLAAWIASYYAARGRTPGILLRGYGADEPLVHRRLVPGALVVAHPDRLAGARRAREQGARILVLDDAFQLLSVARDLNVAVVSAESVTGSPWTLPAGPWRERWDALERADVVVVTRKRAAADAADRLADWIAGQQAGTPVCVACLALSHVEGMHSGTRHDLAVLTGRSVLAAAGIADPESFAVQLRGAGANVQLVAYQDHHPFGGDDLDRLVRAAAGAYVVVTEKDAVKLRGRWPGDAPEPLVAGLAVRWERNGRAFERALDDVLAAAERP